MITNKEDMKVAVINNATIDALVLGCLKDAGPQKLSGLEKTIPASAFRPYVQHPKNVLDRSLQRLREKGKIVYDPKRGWDLAVETPAPTELRWEKSVALDAKDAGASS